MSLVEVTLDSSFHSQSATRSAVLTVAGAFEPFVTAVLLLLKFLLYTVSIGCLMYYAWLDVMLIACVTCSCAGEKVGVKEVHRFVSAFAAPVHGAVYNCSSQCKGRTMTWQLG